MAMKQLIPTQRGCSKAPMLLLVVAIACSAVRPIGRPATPLDLQRIVAEGDGRPVDVKLAPDRRIRVEGLHAVGGKLYWNGPAPGSASSDDVREATIVRRDKGFFEGAGIGAGAAFATGLVIGVIWSKTCSTGPLIDGDHPQDSCPTGPSFSEGLALGAILGVFLMIPGALIGGVAGALHGDQTTFTSEPPRRTERP
jgi:hypothetical protein